MRIIMIGTGGFAAPSFRAVLKSEHEVAALITKPPRPVHGRRVADVPMVDIARENTIPVFMPESINSAEAADILGNLQPDLLVVCDYGQILSDDILGLAKLGGINLHGSLLPKYRGAAPVNWALYHGEQETGVTVIHMTRRLDGGPCLVKRSIPIGPSETAPELESRLSELGAGAVMDAISMLAIWNGVSSMGETQDPRLATTARRLTKADGQLDWRRSAQQIIDHVRAMKPWPGTFTNWHRAVGDKQRLIIESVAALEVERESDAGQIVSADKNGILIGTGKGGIQILTLQPAGKRIMSADEFLRGQPMKPGDRFGE